jgi:hypothetical protein
MDRTTRLAPLGFQRLRLLECLGGNSPRMPGYFPAPDGDVFSAFRDHAQGLWARWKEEPDPSMRSLPAAARLLTGDLSAAQVIVDNLPDTAFMLDHGAGFCVVAPLHALQAALPLPEELADTTLWLSGSAAQEALRAWVSLHSSDLRWDEVAGEYRFVRGP